MEVEKSNMKKFTENDKKQMIEEVDERIETRGGREKADKTVLYSTTFRSPAIICAYIREKSWHERMSLSDTITKIIMEDMKKPENKEIVDNIDESSYFWLRPGRKH